MRSAHAYHHGGDWQPEDFHEAVYRRFNSAAARATNGSRIEASEWTHLAAELRRVAALPGQCPERTADARRKADHADLYAKRGVPGGLDPRHREPAP